MDRRVKERLIGASILVVLIVLVVPELLSGPKPVAPPATRLPASTPEPVRNVTVDLTISKSTAPAEDAAVAPPAVAAQTPPAASTAVTIAAPEVAPTPAVERPESSPISATHAAWAVQLGSFANRANADKLAHQIKAQGLPVYVLSGGSGAAARYRVRIGPLPNREEAERMGAKLKSMKQASSIVAPGA